VALSGFGVRGARRSRRRRREHRGAKGAEWSGVWGWVSAPQPTRGSGGASWAPPAGSGAEPRPLSHFLYILGHRTLLVARKMRKIANSTLKKWWWQSLLLSKVVWWQVTIITYKVAPMIIQYNQSVNHNTMSLIKHSRRNLRKKWLFVLYRLITET